MNKLLEWYLAHHKHLSSGRCYYAVTVLITRASGSNAGTKTQVGVAHRSHRSLPGDPTSICQSFL